MTSTSSRYAARRVTRSIGLPSARRRRRVVVFAAGTAVIAVAALVFGMWLGGNLTQTNINGLAIGGTSSLTAWGLPASKLVMDLASIGVIGLLLACLLLPADHSGQHSGEHSGQQAMTRRCLRTAAYLALAWAVANAALLVFSWSDVAARPIGDLPLGKLFTDTGHTFPTAGTYLTSTGLALVIAAGVAVTETRRGVFVLLPLALYNLVPMALQGHASHGTVLKYALIVHVIAMSLWVGGLAALITHIRRDTPLLAAAVPRFSTLALACYATIAASGLLAAWELLGSIPAIWGSRYGVLVTLKAAALIALGIFGWWHRKHTVHHIHTHTKNGHDNRARNAFVRLAAAEIAIMVGAVAIAVALSRSASPDTILLHSNREAAAPDHTNPAPNALTSGRWRRSPRDP